MVRTLLFSFLSILLVGCGSNTRTAPAPSESEDVSSQSEGYIRILNQPQASPRNPIGRDIILSIDIESSGPVNYQWYKISELGGTEVIDEGTQQSLNILNGEVGDTGQYFVTMDLVDGEEPLEVTSLPVEIAFIDPMVTPVETSAYDPLGAAIVVNPAGAFTDGEVAGLAYDAGGAFMLDGLNNTACAIYNFGQVYPTGTATMEYRHTDEPIGGDTCSVGTVFCETSPGVRIYTSVNGVDWQAMQIPDATNLFVEHDIPVLIPFSQLMFCRAGGGAGRDNIQLRNIYLTIDI